MSTFCTNCGNMLPDQAAFCPKCGQQQRFAPAGDPVQAEVTAPVNQTAQPGPAPVNYAAPAAPQTNGAAAPKKTLDTKTLAILIIAAVAIVALILLVLPGKSSSGGGSKGSSYEDALDNYFDVHMLGVISQSSLKALAPDAYWEYMEKQYGEKFEECYEEIMDELPDYLLQLEAEFGSNVKVSYKITDKTELSEKNLGYIADYLEDKLDIDDEDVTAAYELELSYTVEGSKDEYNNEVDGVFVVKIDGQWFIASVNLNGADTTVDFMVG